MSDDFEFDLDEEMLEIIEAFSESAENRDKDKQDADDVSDISFDGITSSDSNAAVDEEISYVSLLSSLPDANYCPILSNFGAKVALHQIPVSFNTIQHSHQITHSDSVLLQGGRILTSSLRTEGQDSNACNKRARQDERLMKNRESANKSRMKRKNQLSDLEDTVKELMAKNTTLEKECATLRAENVILVEHNNFLKTLVQNRSSVSVGSFKPTLTGVACLGIVCMTSFFGNQVWSSLFSVSPANTLTRPTSYKHSGRVLLSVDDSSRVMIDPNYSLSSQALSSILAVMNPYSDFDSVGTSNFSTTTQFSNYAMYLCRVFIYVLILWGFYVVKANISKNRFLQNLPM